MYKYIMYWNRRAKKNEKGRVLCFFIIFFLYYYYYFLFLIFILYLLFHICIDFVIETMKEIEKKNEIIIIIKY